MAPTETFMGFLLSRAKGKCKDTFCLFLLICLPTTFVETLHATSYNRLGITDDLDERYCHLSVEQLITIRRVFIPPHTTHSANVLPLAYPI